MTDPLDGAPRDARSDPFRGAEADARNTPSGVPPIPPVGASEAPDASQAHAAGGMAGTPAARAGAAATNAATNAATSAAINAATSAGRAASRRRGTAWRLAGWWLLVSFALLIVCAIGAGIALGHADLQPVHVIIDGDDVGGGLTIENAGPLAKVALGVAGVAAAMFVLMLVPVVLTLVGGIVMLALVIGLGVPIVALAMALALVTSPLWLIALFVWFLARRRRAFAHATIAA